MAQINLNLQLNLNLQQNLQQKFKLIRRSAGVGIALMSFGDRPFGIATLRAIALSQQLDLTWRGDLAVTQAQIEPDSTLGDESSQVIPNQNINGLPADLIEGGAQRGQNLFHSFSQFNVEAGRGAYFANPEGIGNIFSRVTGNDVSDISGTLGVNGAADLFLINPNGIIFGENASLDLNGSFLATTADAIQFGAQGEFQAIAPDAPPLLTVQPSALFFNQMQSGTIESRSIAPAGTTATGSFDLLGLRVPDNQNLALIGGDVIIDGGGVAGGLSALDGRIELGGLAEPGLIELNEDGSLSFPTNVARADVLLNNFAILDVSKSGSGSVALTANNIEISDSQVFAQIAVGFGELNTQSGDIVLDATENILIADNSLVDNSTFEEGNAGKIDIQAEESVTINSSAVFNIVESTGEGNAGGVEILTKDLVIEDESEITSSTFGTGNAGSINIQAESVLVTNGSPIINATFDKGNAGNITVQTNSLMLIDGGAITSSTFDEGNAGNIDVNAQSIVLSGTAPLELIGLDDNPGGFSSGLLTTTELGADGTGGNIVVNTDSLQISQGAVISTRTINSASGGNITVNGNTISIYSGSQILTSAFSLGDAGNIELNITEKLEISGSDPTFFERREAVIELFEQAELTDLVNPEEQIDPVSPFSGIFANTTESSAGNGGSIIISGLNNDSALRSLTISQAGQLAVDSQGIGNGGNLSLQTENLTLEDGASISATTTSGLGGNIAIDTEFLIGSGNSDIVANAFDGMGGFIQINAQSILGLQTRNQLTDSNDITAFSQQNPQLNGTVDINTTETNQNLSLLQLPSNPVSEQVVQACGKGSTDQQSKFIISGRGGLPDSPQTNLSSDFGLEDWRIVEGQDSSPSVADKRLYQSDHGQTRQIVAANKLIFDADGTPMLVAVNSVDKVSNLTQQLSTNCSTN